MSIAIETLEGLKRRVVLKLEATKIQSEKQSRLNSLARRVKMDGYRPGKVPLKVIERNYGEQVEYEIVSDFLGEQYRDLVKAHDLKPAGQPKIQELKDNKNEFELLFEVMPVVDVKGLDALNVSKLDAQVTTEDLDKMLETLRKQQVKWIKDDARNAQTGDRVTVDFEGKIDGEVFEGGSAKAAPIVLGSSSMIPGFEDALSGIKVGETKIFPVTFPEDYRAEHLKGKSAEFSVTAHEVSAPELPEINPEFVKNFGIASGDVSELKAELQKNMERELNNAIQNSLKTEIMNALLAANEFDIPEALVESEVMAMAQRNNFPQPKNQQQADQLMAIAKQAFSPEAVRRARLGLILSKIVADKNIKLDDKYIENRLNLIASTYEDPEDVKVQFRQDANMMASISNMALEDQLVEELLKGAKVEIKASSFNEIMKPKS